MIRTRQLRAIRQSGFNLVELAVVIAVIALLVLALTPLWRQYYARAEAGESKRD